MDTSLPNGRVAALDGLRAVLAIAICAYHFGVPGAHGAVLAIPVFSALSGSLITGLLLAETRRRGRVRLGRFVLNRLLRIVPPVLVLVAVVAMLWPWVGGFSGSTNDRGLAVGLALTWTSNLGRAFAGVELGVLDPLWSLSAEEQFYVVWPVLAALSLPVARRRRIVPWFLGAVVVLGPLCCLPFFVPSADAGPAPIYYAPPISMSSLASGCLAALVSDELRQWGHWTARTGRAATWVGLALLLFLVVLFPADWKSDPVVMVGVLPAAGVCAAIAVTGLRTPDTLPSRLLAWRPLAWFGLRASYSLYLWHLVVLALVEPMVGGVIGRAVALAASLGVAVVGGLLVELPADRFRRWALRPRAAPRAAAERGRTR